MQKRLAIRAPNTNAYVERFIQTLQVECLDHFLVFGEKHLDYLVREYVEHYHTERPHQGLGNRLVIGEPPPCQRGSPLPHAAGRTAEALFPRGINLVALDAKGQP